MRSWINVLALSVFIIFFAWWFWSVICHNVYLSVSLMRGALLFPRRCLMQGVTAAWKGASLMEFESQRITTPVLKTLT